MNRTLTLALIALLLATTFAARPAAADDGEYFDFEKSLAPWTAGSRVDKCVTGKVLTLKKDEPRMGPQPDNSYAALAPSQGCFVWMVTEVQISGTTIDVSFDTKSVGGCDGCIPMLYVGRSQPDYPGQFITDHSSLNSEWTAHKFRVKVADIDGIPGEKVYVALSFARLVTYRTVTLTSAPLYPHVGFDNVRVTRPPDIN